MTDKAQQTHTASSTTSEEDNKCFSSLASLYLQEVIRQGRDIEIPSLGISIKGSRPDDSERVCECQR